MNVLTEDRDEVERPDQLHQEVIHRGRRGEADDPGRGRLAEQVVVIGDQNRIASLT